MATEHTDILSFADGMAGIIDGLMADMVQGIKHNARMAGKVASGKTLASLHYEVAPLTDGAVEATLWGRKFFATLETGRGPARKKGTDAERARWQAAMKEWCRMRGFPAAGLSDAQYERAAAFLRWYINKHGDRLYRQGGRRDIFTPEIETFRSRLQEQMFNLASATIRNTFYGEKLATEIEL